MMNVLVFGGSGQLGRAWDHLLTTHAIPHKCLARAQADLSQPDKLADLIRNERPSYVVNTSAYTQVDRAETETDLALVINARAPEAMARTCLELDIPFVHYSTDYVFLGDGVKPWREDAATSPVNAYGRTKLEGELAVHAAGGKFLIFRTSWVYDDQGQNFLNTILRLTSEREQLRIVGDQIGAPTYAKDLADVSWQALNKAVKMASFPSGVYNLSGAGETSWFGFAEEIVRLARVSGFELKLKDLASIASVEYPTPAKRPFNSRFDLSKLRTVFGLQPRDWREALLECFHEIEQRRR
jgi:dTDP-4-dehydrorhamnose reductase